MEQDPQGQKPVLYVGIDLGTSRSSLSASNSVRSWLDSYVGWPKDFIAAKVLASDVLFGSDALENRLSLDLYRPLERGVIREGIGRNEEAVRELIRHLLNMAGPEQGQKVQAIVGVPADTLKANKLAIRKAVAESVNSLMVVSEPFAVAYGMDLLNNAMVIDIGAGTIDFCIMHGAIPDDDDQRTIYNAGDYIDQQLYSNLAERYTNARFNINMVRSFKEAHGFVGAPQAPVEVEIPVDGKPVKHDITNEMKKACETILPPIIDTAWEMIARFDPEFQLKVKNNIVIAGGGSLLSGIDKYLGAALSRVLGPCRVSCVNDPLYAGSMGALKLALDMPPRYWEEL